MSDLQDNGIYEYVCERVRVRQRERERGREKENGATHKYTCAHTYTHTHTHTHTHMYTYIGADFSEPFSRSHNILEDFETPAAARGGSSTGAGTGGERGGSSVVQTHPGSVTGGKRTSGQKLFVVEREGGGGGVGRGHV